MSIATKRIYDDAEPSDGYRILVDRLWPRGVSKAAAHLDEWARDLAPSSELRKWYGHDPEKFDEFRRRYLAELADQRPALDALRTRASDGPVTIVFAARDVAHSNAAVIAELLASPNPS